MAYRYEDKEKAKELYLKGYSLTEVSKILKVNRGTLNNWKNSYNWKALKDHQDIETTKKLPLNKKEKHKKILQNIINQSNYLLSEID